ncbi:MAG: AAA family ATPase [Oligosphaeraceae bacterium]|nr:AAA family ATPase [Oligosphaeraceae bacterium]
MNPAERLSSYLEALRPIVYIHNFDFNAVDELIKEAVGGTPIEEYNNASGQVNFATKVPSGILNDSLQNDLASISTISSANKLATFLEESITDCPMRKVILLKDVHDELKEPAIIAQLKAISQRTMYSDGYWVPIIIVSSKLVIPSELEKLITIFDIPYPTLEEIENILEQYASFFNFKISLDDIAELALAFKGLSEFEITQILNLAYQRSGKVSIADKNLILREKEQSIKKSGLLEAIHVSNDTSDIGGLDNLVSYLRKKSYVYKNLAKAKAFGVDIPKGILIVGMPGCGKSLTAKASATLFNAPLLRLDVGKLLGKYVGESEDNLRRAIAVAEAATPCVLWIDEIEKAFAGVGKDESGGGVTTRLFGYFLTWMQEKDSTVYVVATANDIENIPPEFLRRGRFDEIFSVSLPNSEERKKIFEIHLSRRKNNWKSLNINLNELVRKTTGNNNSRDFSGADIESIVKTAIETAFWEERELEQKDLIQAIEQTIPIAKTMAEKITKLKNSLQKYQISPASITN